MQSIEPTSHEGLSHGKMETVTDEQTERSDAVSKKHLRKSLLSQFRLFFSHGLTREFDLIAIMNQPIEDGICQGRIGNNLMLMFYG
jgi:hypothetical protein